MSHISTQSVELVNAIKAFDYYQHLYHTALTRNNVTEEQIMQQAVSDDDLCSLWNSMWAALPDHRAIQREPFYLLCDLCEYPEQDE